MKVVTKTSTDNLLHYSTIQFSWLLQFQAFAFNYYKTFPFNCLISLICPWAQPIKAQLVIEY